MAFLKNFSLISKIKIFIIAFSRGFFKNCKNFSSKIFQKTFLSIKKLDFIRLGRIIFLGTIFLSLLKNYFSFKTELEEKKLAAARWPFSLNYRLALAKLFFENNNLVEAKKEIEKAQKISSFFKKNNSFWKKRITETLLLIQKPERIKKEISCWEEVLAEKPYYKDVYLRLSVLYYQILKDEKAKENWQKSFYLDPNNFLVQEVGKKIGAFPFSKP